MYSQPTVLNEALDFLGRASPCVVAGGTDVYPSMRNGHQPREYLDVTKIHGFKDISHSGNSMRFGAAVTWTDIAKANLPPAFEALRQAALEVGSLQIQNAGTVVGNICNASPASDGVPPLLALDAQVEIAGGEGGPRRLALSEFILGARKTSLSPGELVTAVIVPTPPADMSAVFEKLGSRRYLVISVVMTAANVLLDAKGLIKEARIAVGACSAVAQRLVALEADLVGADPRDLVIAPEHLAPLTPISDLRGTDRYRMEAAKHQIQRAILRAAGV